MPGGYRAFQGRQTQSALLGQLIQFCILPFPCLPSHFLSSPGPSRLRQLRFLGSDVSRKNLFDIFRDKEVCPVATIWFFLWEPKCPSEVSKPKWTSVQVRGPVNTVRVIVYFWHRPRSSVYVPVVKQIKI